MKNHRTFLFIGLVLLLGSFPFTTYAQSESVKSETTSEDQINSEKMKLGAFSISLNVKDLQVSKAFYEKLGFEVLGGDVKMNYLIMKNENSLIGLFQGMFEGNIITFNPGWDENGKNIEGEFDDVRVIQQRLKDSGIPMSSEEIAPGTSGPASIILSDPDGNMIFVDQHR